MSSPALLSQKRSAAETAALQRYRCCFGYLAGTYVESCVFMSIREPYAVMRPFPSTTFIEILAL